MAVSAIQSTNLVDLFSQTAEATPGAANQPSFVDLLNKYLRDVNDQQLNADQVVQDFITGKTDNVHSVMLAMSKADMSFRMALEVRNKAIDAYQEIMRTPL